MKLIEKTPETLICLIAQCPAIFETDRDSYVVIGKLLTTEQIAVLLNGRVGKEEAAVEFPKELLAKLLAVEHNRV